jgi:hypothetical protein
MSYYKWLGIIIGLSAFLYEANAVSGLKFKEQISHYQNNESSIGEAAVVYGFVSGSVEVINTAFNTDLCMPWQVWSWEYMPTMFEYTNNPINLPKIEKMSPYDIVKAALIQKYPCVKDS